MYRPVSTQSHSQTTPCTCGYISLVLLVLLLQAMSNSKQPTNPVLYCTPTLMYVHAVYTYMCIGALGNGLTTVSAEFALYTIGFFDWSGTSTSPSQKLRL